MSHAVARRKTAVVAVALSPAVLAAGAMLAPASRAIGQEQPAAARWRVAFMVKASDQPAFTAVTASGPASTWAFEASGAKAPAAYRLSGSAWNRRPFPVSLGDTVTSATSSSARNVWAFTFKGLALRFNGTRWTKVRKFSTVPGSSLAISKTDVWMFSAPSASPLQAWHFNGSSWTKIISGSGLTEASAPSATSIWAVGGTNVAHWNGHSWKKTSVAALLPKNSPLNRSFLAAIDAKSATNVYAVGSGGRQDEGGPLVLLHYNGTHWSRIALVSSLGDPVGLIGDGTGGLWIPVRTGSPGNSSMEHFADGKLTSTPLPVTPPHLALFATAIAPRSTAALAVGYIRISSFPAKTTAVILRFE